MVAWGTGKSLPLPTIYWPQEGDNSLFCHELKCREGFNRDSAFILFLSLSLSLPISHYFLLGYRFSRRPKPQMYWGGGSFRLQWNWTYAHIAFGNARNPELQGFSLLELMGMSDIAYTERSCILVSSEINCFMRLLTTYQSKQPALFCAGLNRKHSFV
jgi:hypothetical protein